MTQKPVFRKITQVGLVVRSVQETARRCWEQFGIGPWTFYTFDPSNVQDMTIRGKPVDHAMRIGAAMIGDIEWEIIEPLDDRSVYAEHLRVHGEGLHHVMFDVESYSDTKANFCRIGFPEIVSGNWRGHPYSYFDTQKSLGCLTEIWSPPQAGKSCPSRTAAIRKPLEPLDSGRRSEFNVLRLQEKVAIVTGAASGLGAAIARRMVSEGANLTITDLAPDAGRALARTLGCEFLHQDVTEERRWETVIDHIERQHEALHFLVNNAGIEGAHDNNNPECTRLSDWQAVQRVNVEGVVLGCRVAIPALRRAGGGSIVNMSSIAALGATPEFTAYGASKAAVRQLTRSVALHCAKNGSRIRCNSVHPGTVLTPMLERFIATLARARNMSVGEVTHEFRRAIPQGEFPEPDDIANAVLFLASDESRHTTGVALVVDGGCVLSLG